MPVVTLPDGSQRTFDKPVTVDEVAGSIGAGLRKAALAGRVDDKLVDTSFVIDQRREARHRHRQGRGRHRRHPSLHRASARDGREGAVPDAQVTIGPVIEDGFYYDFAYKRPFTPEDLAAIEAKMAELSKADLKVSRTVMERNAAVKFFKDMGEVYEAEIIASIPRERRDRVSTARATGSTCAAGRTCRPPATLKAFKLMKVAGAYWRGDHRNEMLQRIYGTAWADKKQLDEYLHRIEEAEKRDHRRIGRELDLFHLQEEAPGAVFRHPNGWLIYQTLIGVHARRAT